MPKRIPPDRHQVMARRESRVRLPETPPTNPIWAESAFALWAESEGWTVTKKGWPDFICRRGNERMAVEVKAGNDGLRPEQVEAIRDLQAVGLPTFLWTAEFGLTDPIGVAPESVANLRAERAVLIRMLREAYHAPRQMRRARNQMLRGVNISSEMKALLEVQDMCFARHANHQAVLPDEGMNLCAWLVKSSKQLTTSQMAEIVGIELEAVEVALAYAVKHRDAYLSRFMPKPADAA